MKLMIDPSSAKGKQRQSRRQRQDEHDQRSQQQGAWIIAELGENRLFGRAARAALRDQQAGRQRHDQRRDLRDEAVADGQRREYGRRIGRRHAVARDADDDAAEHVDRRDDDAGDGVAAHELGGTVHGAEEGAFLLQLAAAARASFSSIRPALRSASMAICLPGMASSVNRAPTSAMRVAPLVITTKFTVIRMTNTIVPMTKSPLITKLAKPAMTWPAASRPFGAVGQDQPRRGDVQRQPQQSGEQQHGRESREIERPLDPQRHHQNEHRQRDGERQTDIDEGRRQRQKQHRQDEDDAYGKAYILGAGALDGLDAGGC